MNITQILFIFTISLVAYTLGSVATIKLAPACRGYTAGYIAGTNETTTLFNRILHED